MMMQGQESTSRATVGCNLVSVLQERKGYELPHMMCPELAAPTSRLFS